MKKYLIILFLLATSSLQAATITVANLNDSGAGSLRAAITTANVDDAADTIDFGSLSGQINLLSLLPTITKPLTIDGNGNVTIVGGSAIRSFTIDGGTGAYIDVTIQDLIMRDGDVANGGAISATNNVTLSVSNCTFLENASSSAGGAFYITDGPHVTLSESTLQGNGSVSSIGGGIYVGAATLTIKKTRFVLNEASDGKGGGLALGSVNDDTTVSIINSLFLQNSAASGGGGIYAFQTETASSLTLNRVSIIGNDGDQGGTGDSAAGGIYANAITTLNIKNSFFALNGKVRSGTSADTFGVLDNCSGTTYTSQGNNLSDVDDSGCAFGMTDYMPGTAGLDYTVSASLITLDTTPLLISSQAIDHGSCGSDPDLSTDIDGHANQGACDIGSFEFQSSGGSGGSGGDSGSGGSSGTGGDSGSGGGSAGSSGTGGSSNPGSSGCSLTTF